MERDSEMRIMERGGLFRKFCVVDEKLPPDQQNFIQAGPTIFEYSYDGDYPEFRHFKFGEGSHEWEYLFLREDKFYSIQLNKDAKSIVGMKGSEGRIVAWSVPIELLLKAIEGFAERGLIEELRKYPGFLPLGKKQKSKNKL